MSNINNLESIFNKYFDPLHDNSDKLPDTKGIYAIVARDLNSISHMFNNVEFSFISNQPILYIGISPIQGLKKRDYRNHFKGSARNSTVRKSLGALFNWQNKRHYYEDGTYRFLDSNEKELRKWMVDNLIMYYSEMEENIDNLETKLINELSPPLNLGKNKSPVNAEFRANLYTLRK